MKLTLWQRLKLKFSKKEQLKRISDRPCGLLGPGCMMGNFQTPDTNPSESDSLSEEELLKQWNKAREEQIRQIRRDWPKLKKKYTEGY